jgi:hypothetical protein
VAIKVFSVPMAGFPGWPNPTRSGAMQCATGATGGRIFRHMYDEVGFPCRKGWPVLGVFRFPLGHGGTQNIHLGQCSILTDFHFLLL